MTHFFTNKLKQEKVCQLVSNVGYFRCAKVMIAYLDTVVCNINLGRIYTPIFPQGKKVVYEILK